MIIYMGSEMKFSNKKYQSIKTHFFNRKLNNNSESKVSKKYFIDNF